MKGIKPSEVPVEEAESERGGHWWHGRTLVCLLIGKSGGQGVDWLSEQFRRQMVESLQPQFLPPSWSVHHAAERQYGPFR